MKKLALACLALAACSEPMVPAMRPANGATPPRPASAGEASVVFVRPPSSCDTIHYPTIVDENGHFVGNAGSSTAFTVTVPAGRHAFYAWPNVDVRLRKYPSYDPVGAVLVDATAGGVSRVAIVLPKGPSLRCIGWGFELVAEDESDAARAEFESWRRDATPILPDTEAGERELQRNPELVCAHVEAGRRQLQSPPTTACGGAEATRGARSD